MGGQRKHRGAADLVAANAKKASRPAEVEMWTTRWQRRYEELVQVLEQLNGFEAEEARAAAFQKTAAERRTELTGELHRTAPWKRDWK
jgi:acyl carrier protein phosphodiesterase